MLKSINYRVIIRIHAAGCEPRYKPVRCHSCITRERRCYRAKLIKCIRGDREKSLRARRRRRRAARIYACRN